MKKTTSSRLVRFVWLCSLLPLASPSRNNNGNGDTRKLQAAYEDVIQDIDNALEQFEPSGPGTINNNNSTNVTTGGAPPASDNEDEPTRSPSVDASSRNTDPPTMAPNAVMTSAPTLAFSTTLPAPTAISQTPTTVVSVLLQHVDLALFANAVQTAELGDAWSQTGPFTVFAPTDAAFLAADQGGVTKLLSPDWKPHLNVLVRFHASAAGTILVSTNITDNMTIPTLYAAGEHLVANVDEATGGITMRSVAFTGSNVIESDYMADNGVVHKVDKLFLPQALTLSLFEVAQARAEFGSLLTLITQAGLEETLRSDTVTIFTPGNTAFEALSQDFLLEIAADTDRARHLFSHHITPGVWYRERLTDGLVLTSLANATLIISAGSGPFADYYVNEAYIEVSDAVAYNGIAHIIDALLIPPGFNETKATCSGVCTAGMQVSLPQVMVQVPVGVMGLSEPTASCAMLDTTVANSPNIATQVCSQVHDLLQDTCGCVEQDPAAGFNCSVCMPGMILSLPDTIVTIPAGLVEGITESSCSLIDSVVVTNPQRFDDNTCMALRNLYSDSCGCMLFDGPPAAAPVSVPLPPLNSTIGCTVCMPGRSITQPKMIVGIPGGVIGEEASFAACELIARGLAANPDALDEFLCAELQKAYGEPCGCMPLVTNSPTVSPVPTPQLRPVPVKGTTSSRATTTRRQDGSWLAALLYGVAVSLLVNSICWLF